MKPLKFGRETSVQLTPPTLRVALFCHSIRLSELAQETKNSSIALTPFILNVLWFSMRLRYAQRRRLLKDMLSSMRRGQTSWG